MNGFSKVGFSVLVGLGCLALMLIGMGLFGFRTANPPPLTQYPWRFAKPGDTLEPGWYLAFDSRDLIDPDFVVPPEDEKGSGPTLFGTLFAHEQRPISVPAWTLHLALRRLSSGLPLRPEVCPRFLPGWVKVRLSG